MDEGTARLYHIQRSCSHPWSAAAQRGDFGAEDECTKVRVRNTTRQERVGEWKDRKWRQREKPRQSSVLNAVTSWQTKVTRELRKRMPVGHLLREVCR